METIIEKLLASSVPFEESEQPVVEISAQVVESQPAEPSLTPEDLDNPAKIIRKCDLHWLHGTEKFFRRDGDSYIQLSIAGLRRHLINLGVGKKTEPGEFNPVLEKVVTRLESKAHAVEWAGNLAGHSAGVTEVGTKKIMVRESPRLVRPCPGDWPTIRAVFECSLNIPVYGEDQLTVAFGWLRVACLGFYQGKKRMGQAFTLVGPRDSFKSVLQNLIFTPLFGGRQADPGAFLLDGDRFNSDLAGAEHLALEDSETGHRADSREKVGERIKKWTVSNLQRIRGMHTEAVVLNPFQRLSISANDSPDRARVLPAMGRDLADKFILVQAQDKKLPFPLYSDEHRAEFQKRLRVELPAFADFLLNQFKIPDSWQSNRFGIRHWHNPVILGILNETEDLQAFWDNLQRQLFGPGRATGLAQEKYGVEDGVTWEGTATQLEARLTRAGQLADFELQEQARSILINSHKLGKLLSRLAETDSTKVTQRTRTAMARGWLIAKDPEPEEQEDHPF